MDADDFIYTHLEAFQGAYAELGLDPDQVTGESAAYAYEALPAFEGLLDEHGQRLYTDGTGGKQTKVGKAFGQILDGAAKAGALASGIQAIRSAKQAQGSAPPPPPPPAPGSIPRPLLYLAGAVALLLAVFLTLKYARKS